MRRWYRCALFVAVVVLSLSAPGDSTGRPSPAPVSTPIVRATKSASVRKRSINERVLNRLPMSFEPNVGQTDNQVKFLAHGTNYSLFLTANEAVLSVAKPNTSARPSIRSRGGFLQRKLQSNGQNRQQQQVRATGSSTLRMQLQGANSTAGVIGLKELPGKVNYFLGNDRTKWKAGIPTYATVRYRDIYPGIDMDFYGTEQQFECDFDVAAGADPAQIAIKLVGAERSQIDDEGNLQVVLDSGEVLFRRPSNYQKQTNGRRNVEGHFVIHKDQTIGFAVSDYDHSKELVIDPAVDYSTYLGGNDFDIAQAIAIDSNGNAYVGGWTFSNNFPTTSNAIQTTRVNGEGPATVSEIDPTGTTLLYSTYLGGTDGNSNDEVFGLALDHANPPDVYITGGTCSGDWPTTQNAYQQTWNASNCKDYAGAGYVAGLNLTVGGINGLVYSTYLAGTGGDFPLNLAIGQDGNVFVTGLTYSTDFPITPGAFQTTNRAASNGQSDVFISRIDPTKSGPASLIASTYLGGSGNANCGTAHDCGDDGWGIAVDGTETSVYVGGETESSDFPTTANAFIETAPPSAANEIGFVTRLASNLDASSMLYSTYLGGSAGFSGIISLALGPNNDAYVTGDTGSTDFPVTANAFTTTAPPQTSTNGSLFVSVIDTGQSQTNSLIYSTFIGGSNKEYDWWIATDSAGNAYITGVTFSNDFPITAGAFQTSMLGPCSIFVSELMPLGNGTADLAYSTYFDGTAGAAQCNTSLDEEGYSIAVDSSGAAYVAGTTQTTDFPVVPSNAYQTALAGSSDGFVAKLSMTPKVLPTPSLTSLSVNSGSTGTNVTLTGTNFGTNQGASTVQFGAGVAPIVSWSSTTIVAQVPQDAGPGAIQVVVTTQVGSSNTESFTALPTTTSLSPSEGPVGASVTINGSNFGSSGTVTFNGATATISNWGPYAIVALVPSGASSGNVIVTSNSASSNGIEFTVVPAPSISGLSQNSGIASTAITISGSNFGASQQAESGAVVFNGANAFIQSWSNSSIVALVPGTGSPGTGSVVVAAGGVQSNSFVFTINPNISVVTPPSGGECQSITISGANFGSTQGSSIVQFGSQTASVTSWSATSISASVPSAPQGTLSVTVTAGSVTSSSVLFTVTGGCRGPFTANPPTPGMPPFASIAGGPDKIDLGNLNVHYDIPVFSKQGRGTPFNYALKYDSSIWYAVGGPGLVSWHPVSNWGWGGQSSVVFGSLSYAVAVQGTCSADGLPYTTYSGWTYQDAFGVTHPFGMWPVVSDANCGAATNSGTSMDGTGYFMSVTAVANTNPQAFNATVTSKTGQQFSPPVNAAATTASYVDRNGNEITESSGGVFTDTLGTTALTVSGTAPNPVSFSYTPPAGGTVSVQVTYKNYSIQTAFGCSGISEYSNSSVPLVDKVTYPDGTFYQFQYELTPGSSTTYTGRVASVTLPTRGTISYTYQGGSHGINCADGSTAGFERFTPDTGSTFWNYTKTYGSGAASTTKITDPQGNQTSMNFQGLYPTESQVYSGTSTLLKTTTTCYNGNTSDCNDTAVSAPITEKTVTTQLPGAQHLTAQHLYMYDSNQDLTEQQDYGYGAGVYGSLLRIKYITYANIPNNNNAFPSEITVVNQSGAKRSDTIYNYDESLPTATSGTPQLVPVAGGWGRGNLTSVQMYTSSSNYLTKSFTYFDTGNVQTATDVNGAQTTYTYGACGNSFPTGVSEPLGLTRSMSWNCTGGVETSVIDENAQTSSTSYTDPYFWRPKSSTDQLSNVLNYSYTPTSTDGSMPFNGNSSITDQLVSVDSLGRTHVSQAIEGPGSGTYDSVETDYDSDGRPTRSTLPYSTSTAGGTNSSAPGAITVYDALGRKTQVTDSGGLNVTFAYNQNDALKTAGPNPSGENTKRKQYEYDALGELASVCEITSLPGNGTCAQTNAAPGYWTEYSYDATGNLTEVRQNAQAQPPENQQTRVYTYDVLGRLTSETNPESGFTVYSYDTDSTCGTSNGDLVKTADAIGNVTCYGYDALHRLTTVTYPSGSYASVTPSGYFVYDSATVDGVAMSNTKTRLAEAYTCSGSCPGTKITDEGFSYDARGDRTDIYESTPDSGGYYHISAAYWANGVLQQLTGLSGLPTINYGVDSKGRGNTVSASSGQNPVSGVGYNVANRITGITFGSSDNDSFAYDPNTGRMTRYTFNVAGSSMVGALTWNAIGTLSGLTVTDPFYAGGNQTCSYSHDDLIRVAAVDCGSAWAQTFGYDAFGNINKGGSSPFSANYSTATNQMTEIGGDQPTYDADGNVTNDFLHTYSWNSNGKPVTIDGVQLTYDAFGRMVEQNTAGTHTEIVYDPQGSKLALMSGTNLQKAYVQLPDGATAIYGSSGLSYYRHTDWIGSSRLASTPNQTIYFDGAYAPYGESYATNGTSDLSFTGMNQDTVPNLYDFPLREYGIQGRWPSPDPAGLLSVELKDPQTLNRYAYARNNPLALTDPSGAGPCDDGGDSNEGDCATSFCPQCDYFFGGDGGGGGGETGTGETTNPGGDPITTPDTGVVTNCYDSNGNAVPCVNGTQVTVTSDGCDPQTDPNQCGLSDASNTGNPTGGGGATGGGTTTDSASSGQSSSPSRSSNQQVQQDYNNCVSNFQNSAVGKVVDFGSVLSFARDFTATAKAWGEAIFVKTVIFNVWYHGGKVLESPVGWLPATAVKTAGSVGVAAATQADLGAHAACWQASTPAQLPPIE